MITTLFGIKNCDTVRKARKWLDNQQITYQFHDLREDGIDQQHIEQWLQHLDWSTLFNKRSTTFRQLTEAQKNNLNRETAIALMVEHPTLIKRPVMSTSGGVMVGFNADRYQAELKGE